MFESNFPVDKVSYSYTVMWNAFKRIVQDFSPEDKAALFYDTAASVYRLAKG
jgi:predicted TIM-barrel fold metal-dependent hydrolase